MTPELRATIEDAYAVFGAYDLGGTLIVCNCNVCVSKENERQLIQTPLREIPAKLLAEYTNSAHGWDDVVVANEMRYFLPRYFELIAQGDPPDHMDLDICLRRLGHADWRDKWPDQEADVIDRFFDALIVSSLPQLGLARWPVGWRLSFDLTDVLTLIVTARGDIGRALAAWDAADDPAAAIHMAALRERLAFKDGCMRLCSAYLERDHTDEAAHIGAFLIRPEVNRRIEAAFFSVEDPRLQQILSDALIFN